jgi:hypothetical protein
MCTGELAADVFLAPVDPFAGGVGGGDLHAVLSG